MIELSLEGATRELSRDGAAVVDGVLDVDALRLVEPWGVSTYRQAFQPEFGAYRGLARVLKSTLNTQNCREKEKSLKKGSFIFCAKLYAPNPSSKKI